MKRFVCFLLILALLIPTAAATEPAPEPFFVHISSVFGDAEDEIVVTGYVRNAPVCASYRVIFTYDTKVLQPISGKNVDPKGMAIVNINSVYQEKNAINCLAAHSDMVLEGDATLFEITFKIIGEIDGNPSLLKLEHYEFFDGTVGKPQAKIPASFTVGKLYPATTQELILILQTLAGADHGLHILDVDRNGDELLTVADAVLCARELAAL